MSAQLKSELLELQCALVGIAGQLDSVQEQVKYVIDLIDEAPSSVEPSNPLDVEYEYQNDNASGTGYRECFSSSCAMLARYYGKVTSDDQYNKLRSKYGDTTDPNAHLKALSALGLHPEYRQNGSAKDLEEEITAGRPVAVGWLHKGHVSAPTGGGHWSVVIGHDPTHFIFNDPNGEADVVNGGYVNHIGGEGVRYSRKNWLPRWEVEGSGTGWYLKCKP